MPSSLHRHLKKIFQKRKRKKKKEGEEKFKLNSYSIPKKQKSYQKNQNNNQSRKDPQSASHKEEIQDSYRILPHCKHLAGWFSRRNQNGESGRNCASVPSTFFLSGCIHLMALLTLVLYVNIAAPVYIPLPSLPLHIFPPGEQQIRKLSSTFQSDRSNRNRFWKWINQME